MNILLGQKEAILWLIYIIVGGLGVATARQLIFDEIKPFLEWLGISLLVSFSIIWVLDFLNVNVVDLKTLSTIFGWGFIFQFIAYYSNLEDTLKYIITKLPVIGGVIKWKKENK